MVRYERSGINSAASKGAPSKYHGEDPLHEEHKVETVEAPPSYVLGGKSVKKLGAEESPKHSKTRGPKTGSVSLIWEASACLETLDGGSSGHPD